MKRREFITLLGCAAAWPLDARAQQPGKRPTIGFLGTATPSGMSRWTAALAQRLGELGWIEGRTVAIEYRWAEGRPERYAEIVAEFVSRRVDVIVTTVPAAPAAKQATSVIPICSYWRAILSAAAWSQAWRDQAATSPGCRRRRPTLPVSVSSCCGRSSPISR